MSREKAMLIKLLKPVTIGILMLMLVIPVSCNKSAKDTNKPVIISGFSFMVDNAAAAATGTLQIEPDQVLTILVNYTDPDGGTSPNPAWYEFTWAVELVDAPSGALDPNSKFIAMDQNPAIWKAPATTGFYKFIVQVLDKYNDPSTEAVVVEVSSNKKPIITDLHVSSTEPKINEEVTLSVYADDPDANLPLDYSWQASGGYFTVENGPVAKWLSPTSGSFQITVTVNDQAGGSASRVVPINVQADRPPVIEGWHLDPDDSVGVSEFITITIAATDPDGDELEYNWACDSGALINVDKNVAKWRAPAIVGNSTVSCTVKDNKGGSDSVNILIVVT
jgi:hypothetical protein